MKKTNYIEWKVTWFPILLSIYLILAAFAHASALLNFGIKALIPLCLLICTLIAFAIINLSDAKHFAFIKLYFGLSIFIEGIRLLNHISSAGLWSLDIILNILPLAIVVFLHWGCDHFRITN